MRKAQLGNDYYGRLAESKMALEKQHGNYYGQMAKFFGPTAQANIDLIRNIKMPAGLADIAETNEDITAKRRDNKIGQEYLDTMPGGNSISTPGGEMNDEMYQTYYDVNKQIGKEDPNNPNYIPNLPTLDQVKAQKAQKAQAGAVKPTFSPNTPVSEAYKNTYDQAQQNTAPAMTYHDGAIGNMNSAPQAPTVPTPSPIMNLPSTLKEYEKQQAELKAARHAALGGIMNKKGKTGETPEQKRSGAIDLERKKQDIRAYEKINEGAATRTSSASDAIVQLDILKEASDKLTSAERGPLAGRAPALSEAAQVYDKTSAALQKAVMDGMKGQGQMSKAKMEFIERIKPNRKMNKAAADRIGETLKTMAERTLEEQPFFALAEKSGFDHKEAESLWTLYNKERPEYDAKKAAPIKGNLNQYNEYLNRNALESALKGKPYDPKKVQNKDISLKDIKEGSNNTNVSYDEEKIAHTAKKYNMSIEDVKKKLGIQ